MDPKTQLQSVDSMIGRRAPYSTARLTKGEITMLAYEGSWALLFRHPARFAPVCTTEFIELARRKPEFDALGVELVGLSVDSYTAISIGSSGSKTVWTLKLNFQ